MKVKCFLFLACLGVMTSCSRTETHQLNVSLDDGRLNFSLPEISLKNGFPGVELLLGPEENLLEWYPKGKVRIQENDRMTPKGMSRDMTLTWKHEKGYLFVWTVSKLQDYPGFTVRSSFANNSTEPVRLKNFVLLKTEQDGLVCQGNPASWWLLPATQHSRQAGNLSQVFPSRMRLREQEVYGYDDTDSLDFRNKDGHWRFHEEIVTLYHETDRSGIVMGAVGPGVSYVNFACRVDNGRILMEVRGEMDGILVDPGETRESEEVLFLNQPYREALGNIASWIAETHHARTTREPVFGWCSWYDRYDKVDEKHLEKLIGAARELRDRIPMDVIQIDMGWSKSQGEWTPNEKFPGGMKMLADKIKDAGSVPGIWLSPVYSESKKPLDWYQLERRINQADTSSTTRFDPTITLNPVGSYLDPTHPEVEKFICSSITALKDMGYLYYKFDYNHIAEHRPFNPKMTNFQIMRHLFTLYRSCIGEESFMLACGAEMRPVVGLADAFRIGWDALGRWKSYPLADDSLPTLCTDIYDAIFATALSSSMNQVFYNNDPDVTYLLPRAEDHIWQGPKGSFDPEKHGLKWPGLKTFHSYVGLLGGMTMVSEPLHMDDYRQQNAIRMFEILCPPAPDKAWSMNGDIDPWGRQFGFVSNRPWGTSASVVLWNKDDSAADIRLNTHTLKELGDKFHVWSFWDEQYLGIGEASFTAKNVAGQGCSLLHLTRLPEKKDIPVIVGSNLHISMGSAELKSVFADPGEMTIELTHAGAREGRIYIYSPRPLKSDRTKGCEAFVKQRSADIYVVIITNRSRTEKNTIHLSADNDPQRIDLLSSDPSLLEKCNRSGFVAEGIK